MFSRVGLMLLCVLSVSVAVPASAKDSGASDKDLKKTIFTNYRLNFVKLDEIKGKNREYIHPSHPATVSVSKMREMMAAMRLSRRAFFKKEKIVKDQEVFDEGALETLAPHLVEGLRRASNDEVVAFSYLFKNPTFVLRNDRFTTGTVWMEGDDLHMEFTKIFARIDGDLDKRGYEAKMVGRAKGVRIVLEMSPGVQFGHSKQELVLNSKGTFIAVGSNKYQEQTHEGRLEELTRLHDMGLITKEEYEAKRRAILNQL